MNRSNRDRHVVHSEPDPQADCRKDHEGDVEPFALIQILALTHPLAHDLKSWCTGEDSNLRSSEERQIYSLLPLTTRSPVHSPSPCAFALAGSEAGNNGTPSPYGCKSVIKETREHTFARTSYDVARKVFVDFAFPPEKYFARCLPNSETRQPTRFREKTRSLIWSWRRDLNPRPSDYKSDALPAELRQHEYSP